MNIIKTNWLNIVGVFIICLLYVFISSLLKSATVVQAVFGAFLLVCAYGMMFWGGFIIALLILDLLLIVQNQNNLKTKLLIEWLIISGPFIYWTIKYDEWIFLVAVITFLITQFSREKDILAASR